MSTIVDAIAQAIARQEGYLDANGNVLSGNIAYRNNNPGNLRTWGNLPVSSGYAVFPTVDQGWAALYRQVQLNINRGLTLQEFFAGKSGVYGGYAPAKDSNQPYVYAANVAAWTGLPLSTPLNQVATVGWTGGGSGGGSSGSGSSSTIIPPIVTVDTSDNIGDNTGFTTDTGSIIDTSNPFASTIGTVGDMDLATMFSSLSPEAKIALAVLGLGVTAMIIAGR